MKKTHLFPLRFVGLYIAAVLVITASAAGLPPPDQAEEGKRVFAMNCSVGYCHGLEGRAGKGPRLRDRDWSSSYVYTTVEKGIPNSSMPSWQGRLSERSINAVVAYVMSIGRQQPDAETPGPGKELVPSVGAVSQEAKLGKALFFDPTKDRNCGVCHQVEGSGTAAASAFSSSLLTKDEDLLRQSVEAPRNAKTLKVTTGNGETICGIKAGETRDSLKLYDLSSPGPPVLRTIGLGSIRKMEPCSSLNPHQDTSRTYSTEELLSIAAFLQASFRQ